MSAAPVLVGIGELGVSANDGEYIKTVGLGSCVAIIVVDPVRSVSGLAHIVLPKSEDSEIHRKPLAYYADIAIPKLLQALGRYGSGPRRGPLTVKIVGGANRGQTSQFNIGKRNVLAVKRSLYKNGLTPSAEDVGGSVSRTVVVRVGDPVVIVSSPERGELKL